MPPRRPPPATQNNSARAARFILLCVLFGSSPPPVHVSQRIGCFVFGAMVRKYRRVRRRCNNGAKKITHRILVSLVLAVVDYVIGLSGNGCHNPGCKSCVVKRTKRGRVTQQVLKFRRSQIHGHHFRAECRAGYRGHKGTARKLVKAGACGSPGKRAVLASLAAVIWVCAACHSKFHPNGSRCTALDFKTVKTRRKCFVDGLAFSVVLNVAARCKPRRGRRA